MNKKPQYRQELFDDPSKTGYGPSISRRASKHSKHSSFTNNNGHTTTYDTLPTYIRNAIDHPEAARSFTDGELKLSIELLMELCK